MAARTNPRTVTQIMPEPVPAEPKKTIAEKMFPFLVVLLIMMSFALGALWTKVGYLEKSLAAAPTTPTTTAANAQQQAPAQPQISLDTIKGLFSKDLIKFGDANKKVLLVEIADPSCPYCHAAAGLNKELSSQMGAQFKLVADGGTYVAPVAEMKKLVDAGKAGFVYIYTPGHGSGEMATKAMYCAYDQGKFWQAHDLLMTQAGYDLQNTTVKNDKTKSGDVVNFLASVVNASALKTCIDSGKYDARLTSDTALAGSLGVSGTPGFFVNTTNFAGAYNWTDMKSVADAALK